MLHNIATHSALTGMVVSALASNEKFRSYLFERGLLPGRRYVSKGNKKYNYSYLKIIDDKNRAP